MANSYTLIAFMNLHQSFHVIVGSASLCTRWLSVTWPRAGVGPSMLGFSRPRTHTECWQQAGLGLGPYFTHSAHYLSSQGLKASSVGALISSPINFQSPVGRFASDSTESMVTQPWVIGIQYLVPYQMFCDPKPHICLLPVYEAKKLSIMDRHSSDRCGNRASDVSAGRVWGVTVLAIF